MADGPVLNYRIIITEPVESQECPGGRQNAVSKKSTSVGDLPTVKRSAIRWMPTRMSPSDVRYAPPILLLGEDGGSTIRKNK